MKLIAIFINKNMLLNEKMPRIYFGPLCTFVVSFDPRNAIIVIEMVFILQKWNFLQFLKFRRSPKHKLCIAITFTHYSQLCILSFAVELEECDNFSFQICTYAII